MKSVIALTLVFAVGINANCVPVEISPVCGSDGRTYSDLCDLLAAKENDANFLLVSNNACPLPHCIRSAIQPVCGSDRRFYSDVCDLLEAKHNNPKFTVVSARNCLIIVDPVTRFPDIPIKTLSPIDLPLKEVVIEKADD